MRLWVSGSHDPGEIACEIIYNLINTIYSYTIYNYTIYKYIIYIIITIEDKIISKNYKNIYLILINNFLVDFFFFIIIIFFLFFYIYY